MNMILAGIRARPDRASPAETAIERAVRNVREGDLCLRHHASAVKEMRLSGRLTTAAEAELARLAAAQRRNLDHLRELVAELERSSGPPANRP